jgi:hypothetical protein
MTSTTTVGVGPMNYEENGSLVKGMVWGTALSLPLWIAILGWVRLFLKLKL